MSAPADSSADSSTAGSGEEIEPTYPYPARFRWLKRLSVGGLALLLLLSAARAWWGWEAHRRLNGALARAVAAGEPLLPAEFDPPGTAGPNAGALLLQAHTAIAKNVYPPSSSPLEYKDYPPYPAQWHALADAAVAADGAVFPIVRQSRLTCDPAAADWGVRYRTPFLMTILPHLNHARELANLLADTALREHLNGNDAAALELVRDLRHVGRAAEAHPIVVCFMVSVGIDMMATRQVKVIAPALAVEGSTNGSSPVSAAANTDLPTTRPAAQPKPATRSQVLALIRELLDESDLDRALPRAFMGERMAQFDTADWASGDTRLIAPMFEMEKARMARADEALLNAAVQPNLPAARAAAAPHAAAVSAGPPTRPLPLIAGMVATPPRRPPAAQPIHFPTGVSAGMLQANHDRALLTATRLRAERRLAAISLATRLYRLDHDGAWPSTLQALVPQYLPAVPADPCAADGRPLAYVIVRGALPDGGDRPVVYSVGDNGVDDTSANPAAALPAVPAYSWTSGYTRTGTPLDQWCDLARWAPPPADDGGTSAN